MPTDETRRVLKVFGVAVTAFEDAVDKGAAPEELRKAEAEVKTRLEEITVLIEQLRAKKIVTVAFAAGFHSPNPFQLRARDAASRSVIRSTTTRTVEVSVNPFWAKGIR